MYRSCYASDLMATLSISGLQQILLLIVLLDSCKFKTVILFIQDLPSHIWSSLFILSVAFPSIIVFSSDSCLHITVPYMPNILSLVVFTSNVQSSTQLSFWWFMASIKLFTHMPKELISPYIVLSPHICK